MVGAIACVLWLAVAAAPRQQSPTVATDVTAADFFNPLRVWTVELTMTASAWTAIQPRTDARARNSAERFQGADGARNGLAAAQGIEFNYTHADLFLDGRRLPDVGLRYKGNGTYRNAARGNGKYSLKIDLNRYVRGQKLGGLTTINLQNNVTDASWMNEVLAYRLYRDAGVPAPRTSYARVYVTIPGGPVRDYWGLYSISENVDTDFIEARFDTTRGAILKPSTAAVFSDLGPDWSRYNQAYDPKTTLATAEQRRIIEFCRLVSSADDTAFAARVGEFVDLDQFARYAALLVWLANTDSLIDNGQNYYVYLHPDTRRLHFIAWDQDGSFGNFGRFRGGQAEGLSIRTPWRRANRFLERMFAVEAFRARYLARLEEFSRTIFQPDRFAAQMAEIAPVIRPAISDESASYLPAFDGAAAGTTGIVPFARARAASVARQLAEQ